MLMKKTSKNQLEEKWRKASACDDSGRKLVMFGWRLERHLVEQIERRVNHKPSIGINQSLFNDTWKISLARPNQKKQRQTQVISIYLGACP